jgi:hypothetical protein
MKRADPLGFLKPLLGTRRQPARAVRPQSPAITPIEATGLGCPAHLFERRRGGPICRLCGATPSRPARRVVGASPRGCSPEKDVQQAIIQLLTKIGCRYDSKGLNTDIYVLGTRRPRHLAREAHRTHQTPGIGDLYVLLPSTSRWGSSEPPLPPAVWIEVKAEDGRPSPAQRAFELSCQVRGIAHVMGGLDQVAAFLARHGFLKETT